MVATWPFIARRIAAAVAARPPLAWPIRARRIAAAPASTPAPAAFKPALVAFLGSQSSLTSLLGVDAHGSPSIAPTHPAESDLYPSLSYRVTERSPGLDLDDDAGFAEAEVEFEARSQAPADVDAIVAALGATFHDKGNYWLSGVRVMASFAGDDGDDYDGADDGSDDGTYSDTVTISFTYRTR